MGSINKGSFNLSKAPGMSKKNNATYNQSNTTKYENKDTNFKKGFRSLPQKNKNVEKKIEE